MDQPKPEPETKPPAMTRRLMGHFTNALMMMVVGMVLFGLGGFFWEPDAVMGRRVKHAHDGALLGVIVGGMVGFLLRVRSARSSTASPTNTNDPS